jgi:hypothetical protein
VEVGVALDEAAVDGLGLVGVSVENKSALTCEIVRSNKNESSSWKSLLS